MLIVLWNNEALPLLAPTRWHWPPSFHCSCALQRSNVHVPMFSRLDEWYADVQSFWLLFRGPIRALVGIHGRRHVRTLQCCRALACSRERRCLPFYRETELCWFRLVSQYHEASDSYFYWEKKRGNYNDVRKCSKHEYV